MAGSFGGIEIGKRSLMAHSLQIQTAGHNISNADTEGYTRQRVNVRAFDPLYRPDLERAETAGQIGQGTDVESVKRLRDELLDTRIIAQTNVEAYWETREKYYTMLEQIYNEPKEISTNSGRAGRNFQSTRTRMRHVRLLSQGRTASPMQSSRETIPSLQSETRLTRT